LLQDLYGQGCPRYRTTVYCHHPVASPTCSLLWVLFHEHPRLQDANPTDAVQAVPVLCTAAQGGSAHDSTAVKATRLQLLLLLLLLLLPYRWLESNGLAVSCLLLPRDCRCACCSQAVLPSIRQQARKVPRGWQRCDHNAGHTQTGAVGKDRGKACSKHRSRVSACVVVVPGWRAKRAVCLITAERLVGAAERTAAVVAAAGSGAVQATSPSCL
jgi:hypothetical protein